MAKPKSGKPEEDYKGRIRELEKENKALRRRLRTLEKSKHIYQQYNLDSDEPAEPKEDYKLEKKCPNCIHGTVHSFDVGIKVIQSCTACTYRKVINVTK